MKGPTTFLSPSSPSLASRSERLILFTRYPRAGRTKTRLIPVLGTGGAAALQRRLTLRAIRLAESFCSARGAEFEIHHEGAEESQMRHWLGDRFCFRSQSGADLGARMFSAFEFSVEAGAERTVLIGADCPALTLEILHQAFDKLRNSAVVFGPALDGGYYLIGLQRPSPELFSGPVWGSDTVLRDSLHILSRLKLRAELLPPLPDIDRPEDLARWRQLEKDEASEKPLVSVIIPALNENESIASTIAAAARDNPGQIIVVDGGSQDDTAKLASQAGATVMRSRPGRSRQMNAGASRASGTALLFLHADTLLPQNYVARISEALRMPGVIAGAFEFALAHDFAGRKLVQWMTNLRSRWAQMPYGDQGLFLARSAFEELGGFADLPILEDYEFVCRLRQLGRVSTVRPPAVTSGRRWRRLGFWRTTLINQWVVAGYRFGRSTDRLAAIYAGR